MTFIGHDSVGDEMVGAICRRLRTSERLRRSWGGWPAPPGHGFLVHSAPLSRRDVLRYLKHTSPVEVEVTVRSCADRLATGGETPTRPSRATWAWPRVMAEALDWRTAGPRGAPARRRARGRAGHRAGEEIGKLLAQLEEAAYAGEAASREEALELARRLRR